MTATESAQHTGTCVPWRSPTLIAILAATLLTPTDIPVINSLAPDRVRGGVMSLQTTTIGASQAVGPAVFTLRGRAIG